MDWQEAKDTLLHPLLSAARLGLVTDVDGTISPIVERPEDAQVTPRSRELLAALSRRLALVAAVSGRAAADVQARVGLPGLVYVGNHGLERWANGQVQITPAVLPYRPALQAALHDAEALAQPGMQLEDKGATASIHYRRTADPAAAAARLAPALTALAAKHGLKLFSGRMVFELRPPLDIHKGTALRALVSEYRLDAALYLGDDTTDADALLAARDLRTAGACYAVGVGVLAGVSAAETPPLVLDSADVLTAGVSGVEALLGWLVTAASA